MNAATNFAVLTRKPPTVLPSSARRRQGWLTTTGLEEVCRFISPARGDLMHLSGSNRCESMRRCYKEKEGPLTPPDYRITRIVICARRR